MVPKEGIEPTRVLPRQILSLLRLPVPPLRHSHIICVAPEVSNADHVSVCSGSYAEWLLFV